jgi:poly-gamma-glutamate capsule biosynthesis protein CapA/YwtB (metallophosphatase superfamily)
MINPKKKNGSILIHAVGDVLVNRDDPDSIFAMSAATIREADIAFCQVETNYSERGAPQLVSRVPQRAHPRNAVAIKNAGFHVTSLAGNHCGDFGPEALLDTIDLLTNLGLRVVGVGKNIEEARKPVIIEKNGTRIAFLAYCTILPYGYWAEENKPGCAPMRGLTFYEQIEHDQPGTPCLIHSAPLPQDLRDMQRDIAKVKQEVDVVIVSHHWGLHFIPAKIADYQIEVGHATLDAGADLVLGHHAHILKGIEVYNNKVIFHSMGNFAFDVYITKKIWESPRFKELTTLNPSWKYDPEYPNYSFPVDSRKTLLAKIIISDKKIQRVSFLPAYVLNANQPEILQRKDKRAQEVFDYMEWLNKEAGFDTQMSFEGNEIVLATS